MSLKLNKFHQNLVDNNKSFMITRTSLGKIILNFLELSVNFVLLDILLHNFY